MEDVRGKVRSVWPHDGSPFLVDSNLGKVRFVPQGLENRTDITLQLGGEVDIGNKTVNSTGDFQESRVRFPLALPGISIRESGDRPLVRHAPAP
jgi:hypothetical protein